MEIYYLIKILGWITVAGFCLAFLNYFLKRINKNYISKLGADQKKFADFYKKIMRSIVKNHKLIAAITFIAMLIHFFVVYSVNRIRLTGIIAALLLTATVSLGTYGAFISKNKKGPWLKIHRIIPFVLVIAIVIHVWFKQY
ncbi:hypothetical protein [Acetobacterium bakii]|uniref:DUF4405 domain-containing protein n=1 Tax=Acetobacterium bakii TaxID=52689 RepID=A0A0L6TX55_9FIRM|nr:hypothetical protein [Acetobacterium bakii]KNZ40834.1 hypothetical protein AKG39_15360 [Acetobacterium bakii]